VKPLGQIFIGQMDGIRKCYGPLTAPVRLMKEIDLTRSRDLQTGNKSKIRLHRCCILRTYYLNGFRLRALETTDFA
jgi:hypothetical protein